MNAFRAGMGIALILCSATASATWNGPGYYVVTTEDQERNFLYSSRYSAQEACKSDADALSRRARGLLFDCWYVKNEDITLGTMDILTEAERRNIDQNFLTPQ